MTESHYISPQHQKMFDDLLRGVVDQVQQLGSEAVAKNLDALSAVLKEKLAETTKSPSGQDAEAALLKMVDVLAAQAKHLRDNPIHPISSEGELEIG